MERALVVFDSDDVGRALLREAVTLAAGVDAKLDVLSLVSAEEFAEMEETLDVVAREEGTSYGDETVLNSVRADANEALESVLADLDAEPTVNVIAGRLEDGESQADRILETAVENDIDHVFVSGRRRSPTGKAVFGDRAQSVILNFDGPVTTQLS